MKFPTIRAIAVLVTLFLAALVALGIRGSVLGDDLPPGYEQLIGVTVWADGNTAIVVVQSNGEPNHGSPYFPTNDPRYEPYNGSNPNFQLNPNHISAQTIEFHIPLNPQAASNHQATPLGPIGVALNGVSFFNQYAGPNQPLTNEINSFDQYSGHPQQQGMYHYHVEPLFLTSQNGEDGLLGFLLDGFPVYGPLENGNTITNADLDQYHGHFHATADYPNGIYHYHFTSTEPYLNGTGFYGTPGTVVYGFSPLPTPTAATVGGLTQLSGTHGLSDETTAGTLVLVVGAAVLLTALALGGWVASSRPR